MNHGYVFLYHSAVLHCLGQGGGSLFCAGVNHDAAHIFVKPVDGENLPAQRFFQLCGNLRFGIQSNGLDADGQIFIVKQNFHSGASFGSADGDATIAQFSGFRKVDA